MSTFGAGTPVRCETIYGTFFSRPDDLITEQLQKYSAHARNELAMLGSFIRPGDNIIDVGAHIGTFAVPFARFNGGRGKIFAFEASAAAFELLATNVEVNGLAGTVIPVHAVIADRPGAFSMVQPDSGNSGSSYFVPVASGPLDLPCLTIDAWHAANAAGLAIHLLKVDVEGAELAVLRGCRRLMAGYRPMIYLEVYPAALRRFEHEVHEIEALLSPFDYRFFRNVGARNSTNDSFRIARLPSLLEGGDFFDVLAIPADSDRLPADVDDGRPAE